MTIIEAKAQQPSTPRIAPAHHVKPPGLLKLKKSARDASFDSSSTTTTLVGSAGLCAGAFVDCAMWMIPAAG